MAVFVTLGLCIAATGCFSERIAFMDILVSKYDPGGQHIWSTPIDSGKQDYATEIIETSDGGFAIAGWIADDPSLSVHPRVVRMDCDGRTLWDRTLDSTSDEAVAIAESKDGGFFVGMKYGSIIQIDDAGHTAWNRTFNHSISSMIATVDGGYALAGSHTVCLDGDGNLIWDLPYTSTSILQASDGGFFVEKSGVPYANGTLFSIDSTHSFVWSYPVGIRENGEITSMHETPGGTIEVVYTYPDHTKNKGVIQYFESEQVTFEKNGTPTGSIRVIAVDPLTRTSDGGYAFMGYPFPESSAYTSFPDAYSALHLVRLSPEGVVVWDTSLDLGKWKAPQSVLQTRDGGVITLVVIGL